MASFQAKMGRDRLRMREKKIIVPIHSNPTRNWELKKKQRKNGKNWKTSLWLLFMPKRVGSGREREKKKVLVLISSYPIRNIEFPKKFKIIKKIKKDYYGFFSSQTGPGHVETERRKKIIVPINSKPTRNIEFQKQIAKKFKNINMTSFKAKTGRERPRMREK